MAIPINSEKSGPSTAVLADVQNIYYTTRDRYQRSFNYRHCWQHINQHGPVEHAFAYAIHRGDDGQIKFQQALKHIGFTVKLKPFIQRRDGSSKGDWDVGITIDALEYSPKVERIALLSGDGDFAILLHHIKQRYAVETVVYGVREHTAQALIDAADCFHAIDESWLI